jgi:hypothetical protein
MGSKVYRCKTPKCKVRVQVVIVCDVASSLDDDEVEYNSNQRYLIHLGIKNDHCVWIGEEF